MDTVSPLIGDVSPTEEEIAGAMPEPKFGIHIPHAPPCAQAASLAGMLLRITRKPTWPALAQAVAGDDEDTLVRLADFHLTGEQQALLDEWAAVIEVAVVEPGGTVCVCSGCGGWSVVGSRSAPSACRTTSGCTGKVTKAPRAARARLQASPTSDTAPICDPGERNDLAAVIPLFGPTDADDSGETVTGPHQGESGDAQRGHPDEPWNVDPDESFGDVGADPGPEDETLEVRHFAL